jgi:hypothetical protein
MRDVRCELAWNHRRVLQRGRIYSLDVQLRGAAKHAGAQTNSNSVASFQLCHSPKLKALYTIRGACEHQEWMVGSPL